MDQLSFEFRTSAEENYEINQAARKISESIAKLNEQIASLQTQKKDMLAQTRIDCPACETSFAIMEAVYIQTHWYKEPYGCTGGDYWSEGEGNCICPHCNSRLRLYKAPGIENLKYLFKEVKNKYER